MSTAQRGPAIENRELHAGARDRLFTFLAPFLLLTLIAILHYDALGEWWKTDDPQIVLHAIRNSPAETLFSPADWQTLSVGFTPLVTLSFDLDHAIAGIRPLFFYAHQLVAIAVATLLMFVLLERICGRWIALLTAAAVAASPAMTLAAESLMIRHYVEGLALALAALIIWRLRDEKRTGAAGPYTGVGRGDEERTGAAGPYAGVGRGPTGAAGPSLPRDIGAAFLYLLAMLAKEIYAPLPLLFLADGLIRRVPLARLALRLLPSALAAALYLAWRRWMLGSMGGYGAEASIGNLPGAAWQAYQALFASAPSLVFLLAPLMTVAAIAILIARRWRAGVLLVAALGILVLLPFLGVAGLTEARYGFAPVVAAVAITGVGLALVPRSIGIAGAALMLLLHAWGGIALDRNTDWSDAFGRAEGLYVWREMASAPPLLAGSPGWYLAGLRDLRGIDGGGAAPRYILSMEGIVAGAAEPEEVVRIEGEPPEPRRLEPATLLHVMEERARINPRAPLELRVAVRDRVVSWDLGPEQGSSFVWLTVPEYDDYAIPPAGSLRIPSPSPGQQFRIRRDLPDGTWTLSPVFDVPGEGKAIEWRRGGRGA